MNTHVRFTDDSREAETIRHGLTAGIPVFIADTGDGFTVSSSPGEGVVVYQVTGDEKRSADVISTWPVTRIDDGPIDPDDTEVSILYEPSLAHAPWPYPEDAIARRSLVAQGADQRYDAVRLQFHLEVPAHDEVDPSLSNWNLFWLQAGPKWRGNVVGYLNYYPRRGWLRLTTNYGFGGETSHRDAKSVELSPGRYTVTFEYMAGSYIEAVVRSETDRSEFVVRETRRIAPMLIADKTWNLYLGHERNEKDEKLHPGWGYRWFDVELSGTPAI